MSVRADIAVVHLVRKANAFDCFETFIASYESTPAGADHELVLLFKGFDGPSETRPYLERAAARAPRLIDVPDTGLDLAAYVAAGQQLPHRRLCFLNSFSEILAPGWLGLLSEALDGGRAGAVGATGSWGSPLSYSLFQLGVAGRYGGVFESRGAARDAFHDIAGATSHGAVAHWLFTLVTAAGKFPGMVRFPCVHMRTNAFLIEGDVFRSLRTGRLRTKQASYRLENGRGNMTEQLRSKGLVPLVVDRHGVSRGSEEWHLGDVFWQGEQEDLLVADNQTRSYASAGLRQRRVLSGFAWGRRARPRSSGP